MARQSEVLMRCTIRKGEDPSERAYQLEIGGENRSMTGPADYFLTEYGQELDEKTPSGQKKIKGLVRAFVTRYDGPYHVVSCPDGEFYIVTPEELDRLVTS